MKFKFALVVEMGRATFGQIHTNVEVKDGDEVQVLVNSKGEELFEFEDDFVENDVVDMGPLMYVIGNDLDKMIVDFNKYMVEMMDEDFSEMLLKMKNNIDVNVVQN